MGRTTNKKNGFVWKKVIDAAIVMLLQTLQY